MTMTKTTIPTTATTTTTTTTATRRQRRRLKRQRALLHVDRQTPHFCMKSFNLVVDPKYKVKFPNNLMLESRNFHMQQQQVSNRGGSTIASSNATSNQSEILLLTVRFCYISVNKMGIRAGSRSFCVPLVFDMFLLSCGFNGASTA